MEIAERRSHREKFLPRTCTQRVVHKDLWIAVDMWITTVLDTHLDAFADSYRRRLFESGKTGAIDHVEVGPATS